MMFLVRVMYLGSDPTLSCGAIISGFHEALSPLTIMFGAIALFETMEATLCLPYMMREMKSLTEGHIVAELMLIFAFAYMIEGASGFGTPVALGAPMLVSLGHEKFGSIVTLLVMNTFATVWGAAGEDFKMHFFVALQNVSWVGFPKIFFSFNRIQVLQFGSD